MRHSYKLSKFTPSDISNTVFPYSVQPTKDQIFGNCFIYVSNKSILLKFKVMMNFPVEIIFEIFNFWFYVNYKLL